MNKNAMWGRFCARKGFTLIELLVVVIMVAVLSAVAWPMYKHAVLKSRFSTVMPVAKAVADAQEVYYLGRQMYALEKDELDVTPVNTENINISLSTAHEEDQYNYVAAYRTDIPGVRYMIYQQHSPKFAGNVHCEATEDDVTALWLCEKGLKGVPLEGSVRGEGYKTFLLQGRVGADDNFSSGEENVLSCSRALAMGFSCSVTENTRTLCKDGLCVMYSYNENGYVKVVCETTGTDCTNGLGEYPLLQKYYYDEDGNVTARVSCSGLSSDFTCLPDEWGFMQTTNYFYENGKLTKEGYCNTLVEPANGQCSALDGGNIYEYGEKTKLVINCDFDANFECNRTYNRSLYTYDDLGRELVHQYDGGGGRWNSEEKYEYDKNGNWTYYYCDQMNSGVCSSYYVHSYGKNDSLGRKTEFWSASGNLREFYEYDVDGNKTMRQCRTDGSGNCQEYTQTAKTYVDDQGQEVVTKWCGSPNMDTATGECDFSSL